MSRRKRLLTSKRSPQRAARQWRSKSGRALRHGIRALIDDFERRPDRARAGAR